MSDEKQFALILIDPQNGFVQNGSWSRAYSPEQTLPILQSFNRLVEFLRTIPNPSSVPILISQTGFFGSDQEIYPPIATVFRERPFKSICRTWKPHTNLSICSGVSSWLNEQEKNQREIVIGGCTVTSCVRNSSIEMKKQHPHLNFIVDRSLCGAREDNYHRRCSICFENYMIDAKPIDPTCPSCQIKDESSSSRLISPVEFAFQQMKEAGVTVIDHYSWTKSSSSLREKR